MELHWPRLPLPIRSMYGIYANIWGILMVNVTIYGIHGSYGLCCIAREYWLIFEALLTVMNPTARNAYFILLRRRCWGKPRAECDAAGWFLTTTSVETACKMELHTWGFPSMGVPQNGWFRRENPIKMDDLEVPPFMETPISVKCGN